MKRAAWTRIVLIAVLIAIVGGAIAALFWPRPVPVDLVAVTRDALRVTVGDEGHTRVKDIYVLSAPLAGRLRRIEAEVGDNVDAGKTVMASIIPTDPTFLDIRSHAQAEAVVKAAAAAAALASAEATRARAELVFARADLVRAQKLIVKKTISQRALERAELEVETRTAALASAQAAFDVRQSELEQARAALIAPSDDGNVGSELQCCVHVRAPVSGRVLRLVRESAGVVAAGDALVEIGDPGNLEVIVDLLSTDAVKVTEGAMATIERWGGDDVLEGRVRRVEPFGFTKVSALGIEEQRVNVIVDLTAPPARWQSLGHGYRVDVRITLWQGDGVLVLPLGALFRDGDAWRVFVDEDGIARSRLVEIGRRNQHFAQITGGLSEADNVVLHPSDRLYDGVAIEPRDQP